MKNRNIIMLAVVAFIVVSAIVFAFMRLSVSRSAPAGPTPTTTTTAATISASPAATAATQATAPNCGLTASTTEGPYYVSGTAELTNGNLNATGLPGTPVKISGHVYAGASGATPISGAKVEIWEADNSGAYHPNGNGPASKYNPAQIALRGYVLSGADGSYSFNAIYPGYYEGRARHIHVKATAPGYKGVTSQLVFSPRAGDGTTDGTDSIARSLPPCNLIKVNETTSPASGTFDFRLAL
jgi:protocatechuate 3,4-dioxygenase beta subunit